MITAVVLTTGDYERKFDGVRVLTHKATINSALDHLNARFDAVSRVETEHFFFLDDDDDLPNDYVSVLDECLAARTALAYTDELVVRPGWDTGIVHATQTYDQTLHLLNPQFVHHLALCDTAAASKVVDDSPRGHYYPEMLLYWQLAKTSATHVPRVGYVWNRRNDGLSSKPYISMSQVRTQIWCKDNL